MNGTAAQGCTPTVPKTPLSARVNENRQLLEEIRLVTRKVHATLERSNCQEALCGKQQEITCISDDVDAQSEMLRDVLSELNDIGRNI